jgi:serine/threonine protein kinase
MSHGGQEEGRLLAERYRLTSIVGRGGMGTVWQARDEVLDRDVAVKEVIVPGGLADGERDVLHQRTLREARATARLNHPNIVTVHDVIEEAGRPWIVMEFVRARSLQDIVDDEGPLRPQRAAELGRQTLVALQAAHGIGILHRDVKPSNVLITDDGRAVLTDFGIAHVEGDTNLTQTGAIIGSPSYISPERAQGKRAVPASDLWALGATLYTACEGRPPHQRTDAVSVLAAILTEDPPPPRNAGPLLPVLQGLLHRDPDQRMTAETAAGLLAYIATAATVPSAAPTEPPPAPPPYAPASYQPSPADTGSAPRQATLHIPAGQGAPWTNHSGSGLPTGPVRPSGRKGKTTGLIITIGVLGAAVVVLAGFLLLRPADNSAPPGTDRSTAPAQGAGRSGQSSPTTSAPRSADPALPPAGWSRASGPGYTIGVPAGWRRSAEGRSVFWRDPGSAAYLQVDRTEWTGAPYDAWEQWEAEVLAKGSLPNYSRVDLRAVDDASYEAADIEFTWDGQSGQAMHGVDRRVIAGGQRYAVFVAIPADQWGSSQELVDGFLDSFRPA